MERADEDKSKHNAGRTKVIPFTGTLDLQSSFLYSSYNFVSGWVFCDYFFGLAVCLMIIPIPSVITVAWTHTWHGLHGQTKDGSLDKHTTLYLYISSLENHLWPDQSGKKKSRVFEHANIFCYKSSTARCKMSYFTESPFSVYVCWKFRVST